MVPTETRRLLLRRYSKRTKRPKWEVYHTRHVHKCPSTMTGYEGFRNNFMYKSFPQLRIKTDSTISS